MVIQNRNLFRLTRFFILKLPRLLKFFAKFRTPQKHLLIIKTDAIGDYILFRNYLEILRKSARYKDYRITLLGNELWKDISLEYDGGFVDDFIFISPDDLYYSPMRTFKLGIRHFKKNYHTVLQPAFSRTFINDGLAGFTAAKYIIGFEGDTERIDARYKSKTDKFYSTLFSLPQNVAFEFDRSRFFVEQVLKQPIIIDRPFINIENKNRDGIIIFPGAGVSKRRWETEKFLNLIKLILSHTNHNVYLLGGVDELKVRNYLSENLPINRVKNLIGKTSLIQLIELIGSAKLVVSNETSAVHIAGAVNTPAICVLGGGHFGRFVPYNAKIANSIVCVFQEMECYNCNWNCIYQTGRDEPFPCIAAVTLEKVWADVQQYL